MIPVPSNTKVWLAAGVTRRYAPGVCDAGGSGGTDAEAEPLLRPRPRAPRDQRTEWAYIFGAICPAKGKGAGLVMPWCDTDMFVFRGRRGDLIKIIWWDGQGACLFSKRPLVLEKGRFVWPSAKDGKVALTPAQLAMLLEGIDWRIPQRTWRPLKAG